MPIPVPVTTFHCPNCGWQKTAVPRSDALIRGHNWFDCCPQCQYENLDRRPASTVELLAAKTRALIGK